MFPTRSLVPMLALVLAISLFSAAASAQGAEIAFGGITHDSSQPIEINSDELSVDQATGKATFSGNVDITQGDMRIIAGLVQVVYGADSQKISHLIASNGITMINGGDTIEAANADYNLESGVVTLNGNVLLTQSGSAMSGQRLVIDLNAGTGRMDGRVKTILQTGKN